MALAGHGPAVATQFALTEGLPAAGIAVIAVALAGIARRTGAAGAARFVLAAGLAAAAGPALVLLLVFMTGCGIMIGMRPACWLRRRATRSTSRSRPPQSR